MAGMLSTDCMEETGASSNLNAVRYRVPSSAQCRERIVNPLLDTQHSLYLRRVTRDAPKTQPKGGVAGRPAVLSKLLLGNNCLSK